MAIKTTVGPKGVVSETIKGTKDKLVVDTDQTVETFTSTSANVDGTVTVSPPVMLLRPGPGGLVTGSLPKVGTEELGQKVLVLKDDTNGKLVLSGAANNKVVNGATTVANSTQELKSNTENAAFDLVAAVSGSSFYWTAIVGSGSHAADF